MDDRQTYLDRLERQRRQADVDADLVEQERRELERATGGRAGDGASDPEAA